MNLIDYQYFIMEFSWDEKKSIWKFATVCSPFNICQSIIINSRGLIATGNNVNCLYGKMYTEINVNEKKKSNAEII